jgi:thiol:disulfide interchange protein DsbD
MVASIAGKISCPEHNHVHSAATGSANILSSLWRQTDICNWDESISPFRKLRHLMPVRRILNLLGAVWFCLAGASALAAHTQARLVLAAEAARPGDTVLVGVQLRMDPRWHTYWRNPGASGMATKIEWQLPAGVTPGAIQWPLPEKLPDEDLTTYIYTNEVVLLVPLKLAADLRPGPLDLKASVTWLECDALCVPGKAGVQATLNIGTETKPSKEAGLFPSWQAKTPKSGDGLSAHAWWEKAATTNSRQLILEWNLATAAADADFFPDDSETFEVQPATERVPAEVGKIRLRKEVKKLSGDWPRQLSGVLIQQSGATRAAYEVNLPVASSTPAATATVSPPASTEFIAPPLWKMLLYAFVGGLILNVMPCVLPVIALKILGFVGQAKDEPRQVRRMGLIHTLGVLTSFLILAVIIVSIKAAGSSVGWGFQFNNPYFLILMTVLVTLIALNLFGVFEVNPGGRAMSAATSLTSKHGASGAFFNGLLATVLATSCSAPILAGAVGVAFAQKPPIIILAMLTVGLGLAAPYLILSWHPAWLRFLPRPGQWMEKFKIAMGFPMLGAGVWLCSLLTIHYGERAWWMAVFLVFLAVAAWVYGDFVQRSRKHRWLAGLVSAAVLVIGYTYAIDSNLRWREPLKEAATGEEPPGEAPRGIAWQEWSPEAVAEARAQGRPILVDFTAKWCPTCNTIVKPALETLAVQKKLREVNAVALMANYTRQPASITAELNRFGRAGVPLVLVYPRNPVSAPMVFDLITANTILNALDRATQ